MARDLKNPLSNSEFDSDKKKSEKLGGKGVLNKKGTKMTWVKKYKDETYVTTEKFKRDKKTGVKKEGTATIVKQKIKDHLTGKTTKTKKKVY